MIFIKLKKTENKKLLAVSASIAIHLAIGSILILGLSNDMNFTLGLNKSNPVWVSLESVSGNAVITPAGKRAERKQSPEKSKTVPRTIAIQPDTISAVSATKNISAETYTGKEDRDGKALFATAAVTSNILSDSTALPEAGKSSGFVSGGTLYKAKPVYPAIARQRGYEGVVLVAAEILPDGRVGSTVISKSSGYSILDQAAIEAAKLWKLDPAKKSVILTFRFFLIDDNSQS